MAIVAPRGRSQSKFNAYLEGGPQLMAKLNALDAKIKKEVAAAALSAGGRIIADEWAAQVPVGHQPQDPHPGAYRRALEQDDAVYVKGGKNGASGNVRPGYVDGIDDGDQPRVYAAKLEFADGEPSARPAFDAARDRASEAVGKMLADALR